MSIGLGTYSFFWQHSDRVAAPMGLDDMVTATAELGLSTFQICDYPPIETMADADLARLSDHARDVGVRLELGVRGIRAERLARVLEIAGQLDAPTVRSMLYSIDDRPTLDEARRELSAAMPAFEQASVTLALETYEQVATSDLVGVVESVDSAHLGICLDVANVLARLEDQRTVIERTAPFVSNLHVKDFQFVRAEGLVGFSLTGAQLGDGLLALDELVTTVDPFARGISAIVEHWLPWQGSEAATIAAEVAWTASSIAVLRSIEQAHKSTG